MAFSNVLKRYLIFIVAIIALASCNTSRVGSRVVLKENLPDTVALLTTAIIPIQQPETPYIDARIFNSKTARLKADIAAESKNQIRKIEAQNIKLLEEVLACCVVSGEQMKNHKIDSESVHSAVSDPEMVCASNSLLKFDFGDEAVYRYFRERKNYQQMVKDLCEALDVDQVAVSYNYLNITGVGVLGRDGNLRYDSFFYLFNRKGYIVLEA